MTAREKEIEFAKRLFSLFRYNSFCSKHCFQHGIEATIDDLIHVSMFNCLKKTNAGGGTYFKFTKDPNTIKM